MLGREPEAEFKRFVLANFGWADLRDTPLLLLEVVFDYEYRSLPRLLLFLSPSYFLGDQAFLCCYSDTGFLDTLGLDLESLILGPLQGHSSLCDMGAYINGFYAFSPVSTNDRAGILYVATILSLLFSVLTLIVRWHIQRRTFGLDFWVIVAATVWIYHVFGNFCKASCTDRRC